MVIEKLIPSMLSRTKNRVFSQVLEPNYRHTLKARANMNKYCAILAVSMSQCMAKVGAVYRLRNSVRANALCTGVERTEFEQSK